ncbi:MAG: NAD-dependent epimerase/dehydratase family protein [Myxococcales bacterium]|nr:NAD-dependent epimerase/dehydratase family protein [Myxococcales bacterium]
MHVVVTGAAGFIGSHTCERLVAAGHRVTGLDAFDGYLYPAEIKRAHAAELARLPAEQFRLITGDICDADAVASAITGDVDVVCHLAALAGVRPSLDQPLRYLRTNIEGTGVILERMRTLGKQRLVFASSSSVYGVRGVRGAAAPGDPTPEVVAFREDDPCLTPASPYAATKRMNELQVSAYRDLFGLGVFALRFFTVYGPRQRPDMAIHKFVHAIARGAPITLFGDGSSRRDYTFIDDIVSGVVAAIERIEPGRYDIFNLGGTQTVSLQELVEIIERVVGKPAIIDRKPLQPGDVPITYANVDRARAALGYTPTTPTELGVERYWQWLRSSGRLAID